MPKYKTCRNFQYCNVLKSRLELNKINSFCFVGITLEPLLMSVCYLLGLRKAYDDRYFVTLGILKLKWWIHINTHRILINDWRIWKYGKKLVVLYNLLNLYSLWSTGVNAWKYRKKIGFKGGSTDVIRNKYRPTCRGTVTGPCCPLPNENSQESTWPHHLCPEKNRILTYVRRMRRQVEVARTEGWYLVHTVNEGPIAFSGTSRQLKAYRPGIANTFSEFLQPSAS